MTPLLLRYIFRSLVKKKNTINIYLRADRDNIKARLVYPFQNKDYIKTIFFSKIKITSKFHSLYTYSERSYHNLFQFIHVGITLKVYIKKSIVRLWSHQNFDVELGCVTTILREKKEKKKIRHVRCCPSFQA